MKISGITVLHRAILGLVSGFIVTAAWWLVTGSTPDLLELLVTSFALDYAASAFLRARKAAEVSTLREMYESPSAEREK